MEGRGEIGFREVGVYVWVKFIRMVVGYGEESGGVGWLCGR